MRKLTPLVIAAVLISLALGIVGCGGDEEPEPPPVAALATGTTLTFTDTYWRCNSPLSSLATNGLPLTVNMLFTPGTVFVPPNGAGIVQLGQNCIGPGQDGIIDLILYIEGDGQTKGGGDDSIRLMNNSPGVSNMDIGGHADCGPKQGGAHQDGIQILGGTNVAFINFTIGDYDGQQATCVGALGAVAYSLPAVDIDFLGAESKYIACNKGFKATRDTSPGSQVEDVSFRSGHGPNDPVCAPYFSGEACDIHPDWGGTSKNLTCEEYPFAAPPPPPPPPPPPVTPPPPTIKPDKRAVVIGWATTDYPDEEVNLLVYDADDELLKTVKTANDGEVYNTFPMNFSADRVFRITSLDGSVVSEPRAYHVGP